ncbi:MAG: hypothetical protein ACRDQF_01755 [Thermocrispum sp.]
MIALPFNPNHYYTVAEFTELPEDPSAHCELQDGVIIMSPNAAKEHMFAAFELHYQLRP